MRTLASIDGSYYLELGYDFGLGVFYADHSKCCAKPNSIIQRAPLPPADLGGDSLEIAVWVDGGLVEAFAGERVVITPLVAPDAAAGGPAAERQTVLFNTVEQLKCAAESWQLAY